MQEKIPAVYMRGGTSKAVLFHEKDLPKDPEIRDRVILAAYGSPDPNRRQVDGMGGAVSTTSKVAIISPSKDPNYDVEYLFGQVSIDRPIISYKGNCGNISSAVGPFAIDEGIVMAEEPTSLVRIHQVNTDRLILAEVPVKNNQYNEDGDYAIDGVPGTGGKIKLHFVKPGGAVTKKLLPTGNPRDVLEVPGIGKIDRAPGERSQLAFDHGRGNAGEIRDDPGIVVAPRVPRASTTSQNFTPFCGPTTQNIHGLWDAHHRHTLVTLQITGTGTQN